MKKIALFLLFFFSMLVLPASNSALAQQAHEHGRAIEFPDIPGYLTLKCDFHIHTVFSDGHVWPSIRVQEAIRDGLDAISLTEHIEYQPHAEDIPHPDRNRSFHIAMEEAEGNDLMIVHGAEITPGHTNAIFIQDANKLRVDDPVEAFREVKRQGGFAFWNHPNWTAQRPDGMATLTDLHRQLIEEDLLHGIEVVNDITYSDEALQIALDNELTIVGTSDIHGLVDWSYEVPQGGHRPIMLVFAEERSIESIKAGMIAVRTVAYYRTQLIGKEAYLKPLLEASMVMKSASYTGDSQVLSVEIENNSDADLALQNTSAYTFHDGTGLVFIPAHETRTLLVKTKERLTDVTLTFDVLNAITAPNKRLGVSVSVRV